MTKNNYLTRMLLLRYFEFDLYLVNSHTLLCKGWCIVDGNLVKFRMQAPIFI